MRKVKVAMTGLAGLIVLSACSGRGEIIPTPSPAPEVPTTMESGLDVAPGRAEDTTTMTTEPEPSTTTTLAPSPSSTRYLRVQTTTSLARSSSSDLAAIRACESHSNYATDTGNGYYGAYQFSLSTWQSVGGSGNPAHASPAEQDMRAQIMIDQGRRGEWPNC